MFTCMCMNTQPMMGNRGTGNGWIWQYRGQHPYSRHRSAGVFRNRKSCYLQILKCQQNKSTLCPQSTNKESKTLAAADSGEETLNVLVFQRSRVFVTIHDKKHWQHDTHCKNDNHANPLGRNRVNPFSNHTQSSLPCCWSKHAIRIFSLAPEKAAAWF